METLTIDLINPKAKKLLKDLMDLKLINIRKTETKSKFQSFFEKIRTNCDDEISMEEITAEVEAVRNERYEATKNNS
jgi:hypothetical protein